VIMRYNEIKYDLLDCAIAYDPPAR
jgi:hypothetical protein